MPKKLKPVTIDGDVADQITLLNLLQHRTYAKKALDQFDYKHPDDLAYNVKLDKALDVLISYFGG